MGRNFILAEPPSYQLLILMLIGINASSDFTRANGTSEIVPWRLLICIENSVLRSTRNEQSKNAGPRLRIGFSWQLREGPKIPVSLCGGRRPARL